jgi:hypothetical protein
MFALQHFSSVMCPSSDKPDTIFAALDGVLLSWIVTNRQSSVMLNAIPFTADPRQVSSHENFQFLCK